MEEQSQNGTINESTHNVPEEIDEQIPSCSTNLDNPGYPGFIEAIRQAKRKKKSHDVSFQQHDIHLNEWWNYCLIEKKDPLETNLSVFIGYLEKKKNAGASLDDLKSIVSSVYLISSDMMADQIRTFSFIFLEYAKYLFVNTNSYPTPEL
ncbi:uncharacterized protein LOC122856313 [Aphidius gifuensis]|nr:uncharacterized protein LOC122856313 [Aphidius gifuensis]